MILKKINKSIDILKGIGSFYYKILSRLDINSVGDLLEYFPRTFSDRTTLVSLSDACSSDNATVRVKIVDHRLIGKRYRKTLKIIIHDGKNYGALICFNRNFLINSLIPGKEFFITGRFVFSYGEIQSSNFEYEEALDNEYRGRILPIYPLTEGLTQNVFRKAISDAIEKFKDEIEDDIPESCIIKRNLLKKKDAVKNVHFPDSFSMFVSAKRTFIYEEFFFQRFFLLKRKESIAKIRKHRPQIDFRLKNNLMSSIPFKLMEYQIEAINQIEKDIFSDNVFSRLLQADVGSGKTIVALFSMLSVIEAGYQAALMAPTEVLASQHYTTIKKFCSHLNLNIALFTGNLNKRERENILNGLSSGELQLVIGTHSLFGEDVKYKNLGFVVIDEQQRFGVEQRYQLINKGEAVDLLLMTATPIPRSLAMSLYGDLELTMMRGSIQGRLPVKTWLINDDEKRIEKMHEWIKKEISDDGRAIFVYSLIENSEKIDNKDLYGEMEKLKKIYSSYKVGLIHSKIKKEEKDSIMNDFQNGNIKIIAATTVIEVGIDVPEANVIVVENADNYGLSTLHQLRGRVGRNNKQGYMIMVAKLNELTDIGKERLEVMTKEHDGFKIAEKDLLLRGPGEFLGSRQSGLPEYKFADIRRDIDILKESSEDAEIIFRLDNELKNVEHFNTRISFMHRLKSYIKYNERSEA